MAFLEIPLDRIVRVVVRREGSEIQGTGFRFSSNHVVTAFHVIEDADEIRVLDPDGAGWKDSEPLESTAGHGLLWPPDPEAPALDGAILATPEVPGTSQAHFHGEPWTTRQKWESYGFASSEPTTRKGLYGEAFPCPSGNSFCELTVKDTHIEAIESWGGISGGPVFLKLPGDRYVFAGLIGEGPDDAKGTRLYAVPLPSLLAEKGFRDALIGEDPDGPEDSDPDWLSDYVDLVREKLEGDDLAKTAVRLVFENRNPSLALYEPAEQAVREVGLGNVCMALAQAARRLDQEGKRASGDRVRGVLAAVAPVRFLRSQSMDPPERGVRRIDLEVASDLGAEAMVAARQRRAMELESVPGDIPIPKWKLTEPGRFGIDFDGSEAVRDVVEELRKLVALAPHPESAARAYLARCAEELGLMPESLRRQVKTLMDSNKDAHEVWEKVVSKAVNRRLEALTDSERYYFQIALQKDSKYQQQFLKALGWNLPSLLVVTRSSDDLDQLDKEDEQLQAPLEHAFSQDPPEDEET